MATEKKSRPSQSTVLVNIAKEGTQLFHDDQGQGYALILLKGFAVAERSEFHKVRSSSFRRWLRQQFLLREGTVPGSQGINDALCRISTGGGFCTRQLFTDREEIIFNDTRPVIMNGIADIVSRHDLIDRCIFVTLPAIPDERRKLEKEMNEAFVEAHPRILGALLSAVSTAIKNRSKVKLERRPRMADFAEWIVAAEPGLPWQPGAFMEVYNENRANIHRTALEADIFSSALLDWFKDKAEWEGKASQLLRAIEEHACAYDEKKIEALRRLKSWPADGTRVSLRLRRLSNFLRRVRVEITFPAPTDGTRKILIMKTPQNSAHSAQSAQVQKNQRVGMCADLCAEGAPTASAQIAHM